MKILNIACLFSLAISIFLLSCTGTPKKQSIHSQNTIMNKELEITKTNAKFYTALNILFTGDSDAILNVWSHSADISYLGPWGERIVGWDSIKAEFIKVGSMKIGGNIESKDLIVGVGTDIAYTVCDEVGENKDSTGQSFFVSHRATNIFRLEQGEWKLVHHHTDISPQLQKAYTVNK